MDAPAQGKARVVVLGAGFGGLTFCKHFRRSDAVVTLVDRTNHHLFQPLLYQVATAGLAAPEIAQPIRSIFSHRPDITVLMDSITRFDLAQKRVLLEKSTLDYDYLVLALGSQTGYSGIVTKERWRPLGGPRRWRRSEESNCPVLSPGWRGCSSI
ncbi:MAG: FAD-dependent oxidoreductase [Verrucomicrobiota bacterium]|jgi:NADH dehydrogenase